MFESAELGHKVDKETFAAEAPKLREMLLDAQFDLAQAPRFPVILLIGGVDGAGKSETVNLLNSWMDPRHIETHGLEPPTDEERERPHMFRWWRQLPPKGKIGIFNGSWYSDPILQRVHGDTKDAQLDQSISRIQRFERMLLDEGALLLKFWMHLSKDVQKKRLKKLEADPLTRWRVTEQDWEHFAMYDKFRKVCEKTLTATSTADAPWTVVEATDFRYQALTVGQFIHDALRRRLDGTVNQPRLLAPPLPSRLDSVNVFQTLDLTQRMEKADYNVELERLQGKLNLLTRSKSFKKRSVVLAFEGSDAAGKGGAIRRVTGALDARIYRVIPIAAPTDEEKAQPYLWRFWRRLPRDGRFSIFDRTWYGRVLVERVEGYCAEVDWMRAYGEINDFEEQLNRNGTILCKFWLTVSPEEQLRRFEARRDTAYKRFKITDDDWRNREKWDAYQQAVCDMVDRTSPGHAPWTLVESEDKNFGRIKVLKTIVDRLETEL
jgi:polyphosphate:AMP phosphotransferase